MPLTSKTCTKFSRNFLIGSFFLMMLMIASWFSDVHGVIPLINLPEVNLVVFYYLCCLLSGISFVFSIGVHSKGLKRLVTFVHFSSVYGFSLFFIGFIFVERFDLLIAILAYLLLSIWLLKISKQKWVVTACFGIPMLISTGFFIKLNYDLLTSGDYWSTLGFVILLSFSGLVGLILAANLDNTNRKAKWFLLGINYFFTIYFHIVMILGH